MSRLRSWHVLLRVTAACEAGLAGVLFGGRFL